MKKITAIILLFFYLFLAIVYVNKVPPQGDEIHFLLISQSLLKDRDIYLENNYFQKDYQIYTNITLDEHAVTGRNGHKYSIHDLGLPLITLPFYALGGRTGVSLFMAFISFLLIITTYKFSLKITKSEKYSFLGALLFSLCAPILFYSHLVFTEILASLIIVSFFVSPNISIILLPWLNIRYLLVLLFLFILLFRNKIKVKPILFTSIFSILLYFLFNYYCYGTFNLTYRYVHANLPTGAGNIFANMINVFFDRQYGLFVYAPLYLLAVPGYFLWKKVKDNNLCTIVFLNIIYILPILNFRDWHGGYNPPPARYLIPLLPLWVPSIVLSIKHFKTKIFLFFVVISIIGLYLYFNGMAIPPNHGFIYQDGEALSIISIQNFLPHYFPQKSLSILHYFYFIIFLVYVQFFRKMFTSKK